MPATRFQAVAVAAVSGLLLLSAAEPCPAAGPWLAETGGADMAMAGAGRAALSLDAASLASNPAAIADADSTATAAVLLLDLEYEFSGSTGEPATTSNEQGPTAIPAAFLVGRNGSVSYGLGAFTYMGLSLDSGTQWGGRRALEQVGLRTFNFGPAIAWSASDQLAVGAFVAGQWASPELTLSVANDAVFYGPPAGLPDGRLRLSGDDWSIAGQLGLLYEPRPGTKVGLSWTAPVDYDIPLDVDARRVHPVLSGVLPQDGAARLDVTLPQQLLLGVAREASEETLLAFGLAWQDWSVLGNAKQRLPGAAVPVFPQGLRDTWGASLGLRHAWRDDWVLSTGIAYESSPSTDAGVPVYFPAAEQWKIAAGLEHEVTDAMRLRGSASIVFQGGARVDQTTHPVPLPGIPPLTGRYEDTRVFLLAVAADFRP
jgi:long-chain fatty acid transport protein